MVNTVSNFRLVANHRVLCDARCPVWRSEVRRERWEQVSIWVPWLALVILLAYLLRARLAALAGHVENVSRTTAGHISQRALADFTGDVEKYLRSEGY